VQEDEYFVKKERELVAVEGQEEAEAKDAAKKTGQMTAPNAVSR
jgi:hypothetical protein